MDSFNNDPPISSEEASLSQMREQIIQLQSELVTNGVPLTGRVIHVCHYLPVKATLSRSKTPNIGVISPPASPPAPAGGSNTSDIKDLPQPNWHLGPASGHAAMISGIRSLRMYHEQILVGWTGDIQSATSGEHISASTISERERYAYKKALDIYEDESEMDPGDQSVNKIRYVPVWMDDKVARGHYDLYCKQILWPLFHYLLWQDVATEYSSADAGFSPYVEVNMSFAKAVASIWTPGDLVWVHDYHLLMVPKYLREEIQKVHFSLSDVELVIPPSISREENVTASSTEVSATDTPPIIENGEDTIQIGLFVHTPFPSSEVFRCLPRRKEILNGMLGANLICFQTYSYTRHFVSTCIRVCGYELANMPPKYSGGPPGIGLDISDHIVGVAHCSVGVDAERVAKDLQRTGIQPKLQALTNLYEGKKIIVGRDKLDVVKGIVQKLQAFEKLLQMYPQWIGNVVMIQVTSPSLTDSPKLERQISELTAHINGEYGSLDFIPVHHYHQLLKKDEFYALLCVADLAVITPLRDGMNSTSMEFVIAQERSKKSPSVISEFMGISGILDESLQVNPWNLGDVATAMHRGLVMSLAEKEARHSKLYDIVNEHTSHKWAAVLVKLLLEQMGSNNQSRARMTPYLKNDLLVQRYKDVGMNDVKGKRLFLFDYDGTLAPIVRVPSMAIPSSTTLRALDLLSADPQNIVYIISGRDSEFLEQHLGHLPRIGFSAEHGAFVREPVDDPKDATWFNYTENLDMSWMGEVEEVFKYYTERTTGSTIEVKKSSITWHYRGSDPEWGEFQCRQCHDLLENNLVHKRPIEVMVGKKNLEVRPIAVNKGEIVKRILYRNPDAEFIFCAGDDKTDEDMFRALNLFPPPPSSSTLSLLSPSPSQLFLTPQSPLSRLLSPSTSLASSPSASMISLPQLRHTPPLTPRGKAILPAPMSMTLVEGDKGNGTPSVELAIEPDAIFTTAIGHSTKKTLASWHVTTPGELVGTMLDLVGE